MRGRHRRLVIPQGQDHQFTLFGPFGTASCARPGAGAGSPLPDQTRRAVTGLMVRLILEHGRVYCRPDRETADDVLEDPVAHYLDRKAILYVRQSSTTIGPPGRGQRHAGWLRTDGGRGLSRQGRRGRGSGGVALRPQQP